MGDLLDQIAQTPQSNQPVAQSLPSVPQPISSPTTVGGIPVKLGGGATISQLDSAVRTPIASQTASQPGTAGGDMLDQMSQQTPPPVALPPAAEPTSDTSNWLKKVWGEAEEKIGELVPQAATGPLAAATKYVIEPYEQSMAYAGKKSGELIERLATVGTPYTVKEAEEKFPRTMGLLGATAEVAGGTLADPRNWPLLAGRFAKPILNRLMSGTFATQMGTGVKDQAEQLAQNWDNMSPYERWHAFGQLGLGGAMTVAAATHAATTGPETAAPTSERGTVLGKRTTVRPTTVKTAGVEAPIVAVQQAKPGLLTRVATEAATPGAAAEFQRDVTKPAATLQLASTLSQVASDKIAAHDAIVNGEPTPTPITGTQIAGEHTNPDQIWPAMQKSAEQTWEKARSVSAQEQSRWNQERLAAERAHQEAIDQHNVAVDAYNADPSNKENQLQHVDFDPTNADVRERPETYDELKAALDNARERTAYNNPSDVRQKARDVEIPKAQKALDAWFKDHEDVVSKEEYDSAQRLWSDSERFKEIATSLRPKLAKGTLNGNDIRGLEAVVNNKAVTRRGAAGVGEFQRLLGPEAVDNLRNVARLFDPLDKTDPRASRISSWGMATIHGLLDFLGFHTYGVPGAIGAELGQQAFSRIMNHVLFNPEMGSRFTRLAEATRDAVAKGTKVPAQILSSAQNFLKRLWTNEEGSLNVPGTGGIKPTFSLQDNGVDESGNKNRLLGIEHGGETVGHLNISETTPKSWTINDSVVRPDMQRRGLGQTAYNEAFKQAAAAGMNTVESDISTTSKAARTWRALMKQYPDAITEDNGQFTADLGKMGLEQRGPIAAAADEYNKEHGLPPVKHEALEPDVRRTDIADAFEEMEHNPNDPRVKKSYDALKREVKEQWDYATKVMGIKIEPMDKDPYGFSGTGKPAEDELFDDVNNNKHLGVWRGGNPLEPGHPLAEVDPDTGENYNTMLRAVHDLFGHVAARNRFGEAGEESAWNLHRQMFSKDAIPAMTTETRGQTSWFFNNPAVRRGEPLGQFAEQKAGILPEFAHERTADSVLNHIRADKPFAVLTAENPQNTRVSDAENKKMNDALLADLKAEGYHPVEVAGHNKDVEGQTEHSFFVPDITPEAAADFGRKYKQTAVLTQEGLHDLNKNTINPSENAKVLTGEEASKQPYYSSVDGMPFSVPLDFDQNIPVGQATAFNPEDTSAEAEYRKSLTQHEIATRQPSRDTKDAAGNRVSISPPNDPARLSGLASLDEANKTPSGKGSDKNLSMKQKLVAAFADYEGTGLKLTQEDIDNPDQAIEKIVKHIQDNYQWVYDKMPQSIKDDAQKWYETVHNSTAMKAEETGLTHPQVAGVVAAFSPQNPWDNNRESAYKLIDLYQNYKNHEWTPEMGQSLQNIKDVNTTVRPGAPGLTNGQIAFGKLTDAVRGKKFTDFDSLPKEERQGLQALWLRVLDEAHTEDRSIPTMNPNGEIVGSTGNRAWPSLDVMARGLDILENGRDNLELINEHLGGGNKVRNFYNNIINPWSDRGHFTVDTHQVGAGLLQAISSKSIEAMHNFGSGNQKGIASPGKNGPTGVKGTYPVYQEAGVRAAKANDVRPNQFQSMSWEGIRALLGDDKKTPQLEQAIRAIWRQHEDGLLSKAEARDRILQASGGFTKPAWMPQEVWDADPNPNKEETVLANRPPEMTPEAIVDADKTRRVREQMEQKAQKRAEQAKKVEEKAKAEKGKKK